MLAGFDQSLVNEEPRWIKPIKFFASIAVYNLTFEWIFRAFRSTENSGAFNKIRYVIALGMLLEGGLIVFQAARGVQSHFNIATPLDSVIFATMGITITLVVLAALSSLFFVWKARRAKKPVVFEAVVLGVLLTTAASFMGFSMTNTTEEQLAMAAEGGVMTLSGAHFVGTVLDENHRIIPFAGWSADVGDLRIPHFIGLHSIQIFLVLAAGLMFLKIPAPERILRVLAVGYAALFVYAYFRAQSGAFII